jgi:hypothetical protein
MNDHEGRNNVVLILETIGADGSYGWKMQRTVERGAHGLAVPLLFLHAR